MPIYEYECEECHQVTEHWQSMSAEPLAQCPKCNGAVRKLISQSSFQLKGGGWYADGYSSSPAKASSCSTPSASSTKEKPAGNSCPKAANCPCAS